MVKMQVCALWVHMLMWFLGCTTSRETTTFWGTNLIFQRERKNAGSYQPPDFGETLRLPKTRWLPICQEQLSAREMDLMYHLGIAIPSERLTTKDLHKYVLDRRCSANLSFESNWFCFRFPELTISRQSLAHAPKWRSFLEPCANLRPIFSER